MSFHNKTTHVARKRHLCEETGEVIAPGTAYVRFTGLSDGDFYSVKMLPKIAALYEKYNDKAWKDGEEGVAFGELSENINDAADAAEFLSCITTSCLTYRSLRELVESAKTAASLDQLDQGTEFCPY